MKLTENKTASSRAILHKMTHHLLFSSPHVMKPKRSSPWSQEPENSRYTGTKYPDFVVHIFDTRLLLLFYLGLCLLIGSFFI
jgi:hypothetical protein